MHSFVDERVVELNSMGYFAKLNDALVVHRLGKTMCASRAQGKCAATAESNCAAYMHVLPDATLGLGAPQHTTSATNESDAAGGAATALPHPGH